MAIQLAVSTQNAELNAIETDTGTSAILQIRTGSKPANCAAATTGTLLVQYSLASDWAAAAASGAKSFNNLPLSAVASATGTAGYFRLFKSDAATCQVQGTITATGGGGDLTLDSTSITSGNTIAISVAQFSTDNA